MTDQDFDFICKLLRERGGIVLEPGKEYLVDARLAPLVQELNLSSISDLVRAVRSLPNDGLAVRILEAMVTTETLFFRDQLPFEALRKHVVRQLIDKRRAERQLCLWCAASSTGQEPYSVAMLLRENFPELAAWNILLVASDLSREMIERAREGRYNQIEAARGLPAHLLARYFTRHGTDWQLNRDIRDMVTFEEINLAQPWPSLPRMDLVLLRNVMIYFDIDTKKSILARIARLLRPDGYLLLGGSETTFNLDDSYRRVEFAKTGFYQLIG